MPTSILTSKGRTTIPRDVRKLLRIEAGDRIDFILKEDQNVILKAITGSIKELKGILRPFSKKSITVKTINQSIKSRFNKKLFNRG